MEEESVLAFLKETFLKESYSHNVIPNTEKMKPILTL
jgi:hypothetical protein